MIITLSDDGSIVVRCGARETIFTSDGDIVVDGTSLLDLVRRFDEAAAAREGSA